MKSCSNTLDHYRSSCLSLNPIKGVNVPFVRHTPFVLRGRDFSCSHGSFLHVWLAACETFWVSNLALVAKYPQYSQLADDNSFTASQHIEIPCLDSPSIYSILAFTIPKDPKNPITHYLTQGISRVGNASFRFCNQLMEFDNATKKSSPLFIVFQTAVNVDPHTHKPIPMEQERRNYLQKKIEEDPVTPLMEKSEANYDINLKYLQEIFSNKKEEKKEKNKKNISNNYKYRYPILFEKKYEILCSDMDWNGHTNQSEYVKFVWNALCEYEGVNNAKIGYFFKNDLAIKSMTQIYRREVFMRPKWWSRSQTPEHKKQQQKLGREIVPEPFITVYFLDASKESIQSPTLASNQMAIIGLIEQCENECFLFRIVLEKIKPVVVNAKL